jgi:type IV pilus assembly protein PilY1
LCPYLDSGSNSTSSGADGFDPDFYSATSTTASGTDPSFFPKDMVFHDTIDDGSGYDPAIASNYPATSGNSAGTTGNGWDSGHVYPYKVLSGGSYQIATVGQFCTGIAQGRSQTGADNVSRTVESICNRCMSQRGFFYDGRILRHSQESISNKAYPSFWYTGNYLNFFPPKFVVARKVVKDVLAANVEMRAAIGRFLSSTTNQKGLDIVQPFNPVCSMPDSNFYANRVTYKNTIDDLTFGGGTPLAKSLLNVGQFYHSPGLDWFSSTWKVNEGQDTYQSDTNKNSYSICFSCQTSSIIVVTDGAPKFTDDSVMPAGTATLADAATKYAGDVTTGFLTGHETDSTPTYGIPTADCPHCNVITGNDSAGNSADYLNNLTRVAWYLHNFDLRNDNEATNDCQNNGGNQTLDVYTIGFGTAGNSNNANLILANAAKEGGGLFFSAEDPSALRNGLLASIQEISNRSTSFSVATISTLQSTQGNSVLVPRFDPSNDAHWKGHLYRYDLYSEFVQGCTPRQNTSGAWVPDGGDLDCDGKCASVFLQDKNGHFIMEDANGGFVQTSPNKPPCILVNRCASACGNATHTPAVPEWDAAQALTDTTTYPAAAWLQRPVYTVVDRTSAGTSDGNIDSSDEVFLLRPTDTIADRIMPYVNVSGSICDTIAARVETAGDATEGAAIRSSNRRECVKTMIRYLLGADVFNERAQRSPNWPKANQDLLPDRDMSANGKLGDIFHSSPVQVDPPLPSTGILCARGMHNQCISSLWDTPVTHEYNTAVYQNAYDQYATLYAHRRKIAVVGANDGLLHAFDAGAHHTGDDASTTCNATGCTGACTPACTSIDESQPPFDGYYDKGTGREIWSFLPPDLLPKLSLYLSGTHQLFVDGTPMIRDVWLDGTGNGRGGTAQAADDKKQAREFHTVAVVGERRGGTHYFALDLTDATEPPTSGSGSSYVAPKFLWIYPQPSSAEQLLFGETYGDFLPTPPPIGPVRIKADTNAHDQLGSAGNATATKTMSDGTPYNERWVVLLAGGFDPHYLRGKGVHMVDIGTGKELFDFSHPAVALGATGAPASSDPRWALDYPVAATPAMVTWGSQAKLLVARPTEGYFDTATFGDAGGQLWVLRFATAAAVDSNGKVSNSDWLGARVFQMGGSGDGKLCGNQPFFYITANMALETNGYYRVLAGTGDRYNLTELMGGYCGPDNIRACAQWGCTVTLASSTGSAGNELGSGSLGLDTFSLTQNSCGGGTVNPTIAMSTATGSGCRGTAKASIQISCPNSTFGNGNTSSTKDVEVTCGADDSGNYGCLTGSALTCQTGNGRCDVGGAAAYGAQLRPPTGSTPPGDVTKNTYYSILVFNPNVANRGIFTTSTQAATYDANRLTDSSLTAIDGTLATPDNTASVNGDGFALSLAHSGTISVPTINYNDDGTITESNNTYVVAATDERTASPSAVVNGCAYWNTTQPTTNPGTTGNCDRSKCTSNNRRVNFFYGADAGSGGLCLSTSTGTIRSVNNATIVPPPAPQLTAFVNASGQVAFGLTSLGTESGAQNVSVGPVNDPVTILEWTPVDRQLHACRHDGQASACMTY